MEWPTWDHKVTSEQIEEREKLLSQAKEASKTSKAKVVELEAALADLRANRTDKLTTVDEILARYPEIKKQIDEEAKQGDWAKGIPL